MTVDNLLSRLSAVRSQRRGWRARCPGHDDRNPSLTIAEGNNGILLRCWAGCTVHEICEAIGIAVRDLFFAAGGSSDPLSIRRNQAQRLKSRPLNWRRFAGELESEALGLRLRAENVMAAASGVDLSPWSEGDIESALDAIDRAQLDAARADCLDRVAFTLRVGGLKKGT